MNRPHNTPILSPDTSLDLKLSQFDISVSLPLFVVAVVAPCMVQKFDACESLYGRCLAG